MTDQTHKCWFHGSPEELSTLRVGSWVTPYREFAKAFSHKPTRVSATGDDLAHVRHDGKVAGFLYVVAETLADQDLEELPGTNRTHWKTTRVLKMRLVEEVPLVDTEMLSDAESVALAKSNPEPAFGVRAEKMIDPSGIGRPPILREFAPWSTFLSLRFLS